MSYCKLEKIESGTFRAMQNLSHLDLARNSISQIQKGMLEGPGNDLRELYLDGNKIATIADGTFRRFKNYILIDLSKNLLSAVPDLTGLVKVLGINFSRNKISDISRLGTSGRIESVDLTLTDNQIDHIPSYIFQNFNVTSYLDLSFNKLRSLPKDMFLHSSSLLLLGLSFNNITHISRHYFTGLKSLRILMMIKNNLSFIPKGAFAELPLRSLFLHSNSIKKIDGRAFIGLHYLELLTLYDNPLTSLPDGIFSEMTRKMKVSISCTQLRELPRGLDTMAVIKCAPSETFHIILTDGETYHRAGFTSTGFECRRVKHGKNCLNGRCYNCSLCPVALYNEDGGCLSCPAGGFYQDEMGQVQCKKCSVGTYVSVERHPGKSATDCWACPYGTLSNETAGYRACRCLHGFYRLDRFGPCSACLAQGTDCVNDTAILAPNYYWNWTNQRSQEFYKKFVYNIHTLGPDYQNKFSKFTLPLPKPVKCPYANSCKGGIDSECHEGYKGNLCATCTEGYYLRFNTCLKCPRLAVSIISSLLVLSLFVLVFLMVFWGDSKKMDNDRTVADVITSCFKIVIGFYQVIVGIFSALAKVQWPVALISMERCLKLFEGNIFQFAPLSCIYPQLRMDQFFRFILVLSVNALVVCLVFVYLFIKRRLIKNTLDRPESEKLRAVSSLKKSCYRNIFLFLLASYPITSKVIIQILPLPGACVTHCFTDDTNQCISLLRADYSIKCFTSRHNFFWPIAAAFCLYPLGFPLVVLFLLCKYRQSPGNEEIAFGLRVFFENYKDKFWFWEITEMYRKLILIALIFLFGSEGLSQIGLTVFTVSVFGVAYTFFRPIKCKFEDRLQTFVLWVIFCDVCLGAMYTNCEINHGHKGNDSLLVNVLFVALNSSVLLVALGKGIAYVKFFWKTVSMCRMQCFNIFRRRAAFVRNKVFSRLQSWTLPFQRSEGSERRPLLLQ